MEKDIIGMAVVALITLCLIIKGFKDNKKDNNGTI